MFMSPVIERTWE